MFSFFLRRFPDGIAEGAKFFSQAEIFAVGIGHQAGLIQTEAAVSFHIVLGDMDGHYLGQEHIVGAKGFHFFYFALQVYGAFCHHGAARHRSRNRCEAGLLEFIHVSSGAHAAVIGGLQKFFCGQVDDEGLRLF